MFLVFLFALALCFFVAPALAILFNEELAGKGYLYALAEGNKWVLIISGCVLFVLISF